MQNAVPEGLNFDEKQMRFDLNHALDFNRIFGAFRLYGTSDEVGAPLSKPLYGRKYYSFDDFKVALADMQDNCRKWSADDPNIQIGYALVYVMDGSGQKPKFHAHLWKPEMPDRLIKIDYSRMHDGKDPYEPSALAALLNQSRASKVSTIAKAAYEMTGSRISDLHPSVNGYGKDIHLMMFRNTLIRLTHTNPMVVIERGKDLRGYDAKIEHLGIYDTGACLPLVNQPATSKKC